jgi:hypothetical protein
MRVLAPVVIDDLDEHFAKVVTGLIEAHELEADEWIAQAMANAFLEGVKLGAAEIAAVLINQGVDVQLDLSNVRMAS